VGERRPKDRVTLRKTLIHGRHSKILNRIGIFFFNHVTKHNTIQNCTGTIMNHVLVFLHGQHNMATISTISTSPKQKLTY